MPTLIVQLPGGGTNKIQASAEFADAAYPGKWAMAAAELQAADPVVVPAIPRIRATALKLRLTAAERTSYRAAAKNTPAVDDFWDILNTGGCIIRLDDPAILAGLALVLTPQRVTTVTTDAVKPEEIA